MDLGIFKAYDVRGLYGEQIDGDVAEQVGRAFARVLAGLRGKATSELRVGLGRDMRLTAPELAGRYRDGLVAEGVHVLDAGMVGTELLYFLVGSRELDGGLMCTASHNPRAYTGAKLVREGALALSGDAGIGDMRDLCAAGLPPADGPRGSVEEVDVSAAFRAARPRLRRRRGDQAHEGRARRRQRHGGPDGRPAARAHPRAGARHDLLGARRRVPRPRAQPAAAGEPAVRDRQGPQRGRRPRHRVGRRRRPLLLHRRGRRVRRRRLRLRAARPRRAGEAAGRGDPLRRALLAGGARHGARRGRDPARSTASATPSSSRACARRAAPSAARSRATTTSPTSTTPTPGRSPRCSCSSCSAAPARRSPSCSSPTARATSSPARSTRRSPTRPGGSRPSASATRTRRSPSSTGSRSTTTTGTSTCARPTPSRSCASASRASSRARTWRPGATRCSALIRS